MKQIDFSLTADYIELIKLLKVTGVAASGGEAKNLIMSDEIKVNGELTQVKRLKLRSGDVVTCQDFQINIK